MRQITRARQALLATLLAPLRSEQYCTVCGTWYDPADPQGDWNHVH